MNDPNEMQPLLYSKYAEWWPLLSSPDEYTKESRIYTDIILSHCRYKPTTLLELGSGGGNNAMHMKSTFHITLVDLSGEMLDVSRRLNPECTHIQGDMRTLSIGRQYDAVFIHDAISHMTTKDDLRRAIGTAYQHCKAGGVALFCPDNTIESLKESAANGGSDAGDKGLRYLEWTIPDAANRNSYSVYMIYLLRTGLNVIASELDRLHCGAFGTSEWMELLSEAGFKAKVVRYPDHQMEEGNPYMFVGQK